MGGGWRGVEESLTLKKEKCIIFSEKLLERP